MSVISVPISTAIQYLYICLGGKVYPKLLSGYLRLKITGEFF